MVNNPRASGGSSFSSSQIELRSGAYSMTLRPRTCYTSRTSLESSSQGL
jgi:hypothetical protein